MMLRPPNAVVPPTVPGVLADTRGRVLRAEQRQDRPDYTPRFCLTAVNAGPMSGTLNTQRWWPWLGAVDLEYVIATADGASGAHEILVQRSGLPVVTINGTGDSVHRIGTDSRWTLGDWVDVVCTGAIESLCVQMHFRGQGGGGLVFPGPGPLVGWSYSIPDAGTLVYADANNQSDGQSVTIPSGTTLTYFYVSTTSTFVDGVALALQLVFIDATLTETVLTEIDLAANPTGDEQTGLSVTVPTGAGTLVSRLVGDGSSFVDGLSVTAQFSPSALTDIFDTWPGIG